MVKTCPHHKGQTTIRVGQFTDSYPPIINGVSTFVNEHHRELLHQGIDAAAFTFGEPFDDPHPNIYRSPGIRLPDQVFQANFRLSRTGRAAAAQMDIFHVHEPFLIANNAERIARRLGRPIIFTNHTRHDLYANNYPKLSQPVVRRYIDNRVTHMIRVSTLASTPSEDAARWMRSLVPDLPPERIQVMRNGLDLSAFVASAAPHSRDMFQIPADRTVLIYVGRLTPEKNLTVCAHAFRQAVEAGADVHWLIIGDGSGRDLLAEILAPVRDRVQFVGKVAHDSIASYLALADLFVTASLSEINPMSLIEALAFGLPYVGLRAPWWDEFQSTAPAGILADHDPSALAAAIRQLSDSAARRAELRQNAHLLSVRFDIQAVTARWIALYQMVTERAAEARRYGAPDTAHN